MAMADNMNTGTKPVAKKKPAVAAQPERDLIADAMRETKRQKAIAGNPIGAGLAWLLNGGK